MSARAVRLPIVGARSAERADAIPSIDASLRTALGAPSVVVASVTPGALEAALGALRAAARPSPWHELHVRVRDAERTSRVGASLELEGSLTSLPARLLEADRHLESAPLILGSGPALVRLRRAGCAVLVTSALPASEWPADVRSVREHFDLIVPELDDALAQALLARLRLDPPRA